MAYLLKLSTNTQGFSLQTSNFDGFNVGGKPTTLVWKEINSYQNRINVGGSREPVRYRAVHCEQFENRVTPETITVRYRIRGTRGGLSNGLLDIVCGGDMIDVLVSVETSKQRLATAWV
ncbi:hypothetical protein ACJJTC_004271 [Scirpophaga incertulas]